MSSFQQENTEGLTTKARNWAKRSIMLRLMMIGFIILILLIPQSLIEEVVYERQSLQERTQREIQGDWSFEQSLNGLVLTVPYRVYYEDSEGDVHSTTHYAHFLPDQLNIKGVVEPEIRYRGIYEVVLYQSNLEISGEMPFPDFSEWSIEEKSIIWEDAFVGLGISEMRGIEERIILNWGEQLMEFEPGVDVSHVIKSGLSVPVDLDPSNKSGIPFSFSLKLKGSESINFIPLGKETNVDIYSSWSTPSFNGNFLPDQKEIDENGVEGFSATWQILSLNRNYPQKWVDENYHPQSSKFGVSLLMPVDTYQKTMRTIKYAMMIILLTFTVFFFIEILNKTRIHPIQYLLVGFALSMFYILLLSISEHLNFTIAYLLGSSAVTALIGVYAAGVFRNTRITLMLGGLLVIVYGFIYTLLQLEQYALLAGSLGLFIVLAIVMYVSRKIDWYSLSQTNDE